MYPYNDERELRSAAKIFLFGTWLLECVLFRKTWTAKAGSRRILCSKTKKVLKHDPVVLVVASHRRGVCSLVSHIVDPGFDCHYPIDRFDICC